MALENNGFHFTHSLGQNFLFDEELLTATARGAGAYDGQNVLEIGPGAGMLTGIMAAEGANVVALELDKNLENVLASTVGGLSNVEIIYTDALKADIDAITRERFGSEDYVIAANLPYYITADFILKALALENKPKAITLMLQKEAAERVMSSPGCKEWCALAATAQFYCDISDLFDVPAAMFTPPPHVDSRLIRLDLRQNRICDDERGFVRFLKTAFLMRRKTLVNNMMSGLSVSRQEAEAALTAAGQDVRVRGEALTLEELLKVYRELNTRSV